MRILLQEEIQVHIEEDNINSAITERTIIKIDYHMKDSSNPFPSEEGEDLNATSLSTVLE